MTKMIKLWGLIIIVCFCLICTVEAADKKELERSFLQTIKIFWEAAREYNKNIKLNYEKYVKYDPTHAGSKIVKPYSVMYSDRSSNFNYDIKVTNSLISPYVGIVIFRDKVWKKEGYTREECIRSNWKSMSFKTTWKFFYQDGKWIQDKKPFVEIDHD